MSFIICKYMAILFICYPKCGTCKKAQKWLEERNIEYTFRDITLERPTEGELRRWIKASGLEISRFFNTSGMLYRQMKLKDKVKTLPEEALLEILASDGMLVKRPVLVLEKDVLIGFNEKKWAERF